MILEVDGHDVVAPDDLARLIASKKPGEKVTLTILRDGEKKQVEVTLGKRPDSSRRRLDRASPPGGVELRPCFRKSPSARSPSPTTRT